MRTAVSNFDYGETLRRLLDAIARRGLSVFAQIDHAAAARAAGMELADEAVVLFGNPRAGTPLMQRDPRIGIELPLRVLVWSEGERTLVAHHDPRELVSSYDVAPQAATLEAMGSLLDEIVREAVGEADVR
ncbi:MAG: DUF302 domain-containing protein [Actinomycetota bacterium]